jgi:NTE family protein
VKTGVERRFGGRPVTSDESSPPTVAIACQGGGSHTAFTAGVLDRLLEEEAVAFDVVGLSGTSGGAICAFATWFGLASEGRFDGRGEARRLLAQIWDDLAAEGWFESVVNAFGVGFVRTQGLGVPLPTVSPYDNPAAEWGREELLSTLEAAVDPDELDALVDGSDAELPRLDIGAVDVQRGTFRTFTERDVTHDAVLASAAVPNLFQAAPVTHPDGTTRWYWDGLFSQNPPLKDLFRAAEDRMERPDELWVVQINPQREDDIPEDIDGIADRRNELGGNLSVNQELRFIRQLNQWEATGALEDVYEPVEVKTIDLDESVVAPGRSFDYATKLDRSPRFLDRLWAHGRQQAETFLSAEKNRRLVRRTVGATWTREAATAVGEHAEPTYEANVPTSLSKLHEYVYGQSDAETAELELDEVVEFATALRGAIPDLSVSVEEMLAEPNKVATRWRATGTHSGELFDIEPTGEDVTLSGLRIDHVGDDRFEESWLLFEEWSLLRQLNAVETPTPVATLSRVTPTAVVTQLSAPAENEAIARTVVEDVWNRGRRERLDQVLADDFVLYLDNVEDANGRDAYWKFVQQYRNAFPDLSLTVEDTVSEGDKIVLRETVRGTHEGTVLGVEPSGNRVEVDRMVIHHVDDGRIVETGIVEDTLGLLTQIDAPLPERRF